MDARKRIGDVERDAAVQSLRNHLEAGRITLEEFNDRMSHALQAKTQLDLSVLFEDLPGGAPQLYKPAASQRISPSASSHKRGLHSLNLGRMLLIFIVGMMALGAVATLGAMVSRLWWLLVLLTILVIPKITRRRP